MPAIFSLKHIASLALIIGSGAPVPVNAQARSPGWNVKDHTGPAGARSYEPPRGSYRLSCTNIAMSADARVLTASCDNGNGERVNSSLKLASDIVKSGLEIANCSGILTARGPGPCPALPSHVNNVPNSGNTISSRPTGPYTQSCDRISWDGVILAAWCLTDSGDVNFSYIEYGNEPDSGLDKYNTSKENEPVANCNGWLC